MWTSEQLSALAQRRTTLVAVTGVLSLALGAGAGYVTASKRLKKKFEDIATDEIAGAREHYEKALAHIKEEHAEKLVETRTNALTDLGYTRVGMKSKDADILDETVEKLGYDKPGRTAYNKPVDIPEDAKPVLNVFEQAKKALVQEEDLPFDLEEDMRHRTGNTPYVITQEEYDQNGGEYDQLDFTYYEGDDILTDGFDKPVEDVELVISPDILKRFGVGNPNPNCVYFQNDRLEFQGEINRSKGKYVEEVLGFHEDED